jgi:prolyl 4-hydroxylase
LNSHTGVQRVPNPRLDLFILRKFLGPEECSSLCELIDANRRPSTLADDQGH